MYINCIPVVTNLQENGMELNGTKNLPLIAESHPFMIATALKGAHDSWDDESDWEQDNVSGKHSHHTTSISSATTTTMLASGDLPRNVQEVHPVFSSNTSAGGAVEKNEYKPLTVQELLMDQFQNGQHPIITSLPVVNSSAIDKKKKPIIDRKQDDIFASMGLSTMPKMKVIPHEGKEGYQQTVPNVPFSKPSTTTMKDTAVLDEECNWEDDEDLDDLLNE